MEQEGVVSLPPQSFRSNAHTSLEDHVLTSAWGSVLWEIGLLASVSSWDTRLCPRSRDMGPLGQWRLQDSSGLWTELALVRATQQCGDVLSTSFSLCGYLGRLCS